ncbi:MAG: hypothetical protein KC415_14020 [Anaerolineales bacterium]|nr:hypothetical protein [Anaerolineales bacterium]
MQVEHVLEKLYLGNHVAELDQNLSKYFIRNAAFSSLINGRADLIAGDKGTGKSAIFKYLKEQYTSIEQLNNIEIVTGFNRKGSPMFNDLKRAGDLNEQTYIIIWKTYIFSLLGNWVLDFLDGHRSKSLRELDWLLTNKLDLRSKNDKPAGIFSNLVSWAKNHLVPTAIGVESSIDPLGFPVFNPKIELGERISQSEQADDFIPYIPDDNALRVLHDVLVEYDLTIWILLDRLDEAFIALPNIEKPALRALLRTYLDLLEFERIGLKLFVRKDLFRKIVSGGFVNLTHISAQRIEIDWYKDDLLSVLCERIRQSDSFLETIQGQSLTDKQLFNTIFPYRMGNGSNHQITWRWMLSYIRDGNNVYSPRNLIDLVNKAIYQQIRREQRFKRKFEKNQPLIEYQSLRMAYEQLSKERVIDTLLAEVDAEVKVLIEALRNGKSEHNLDSLKQLFGVDNESHILSYASALRDIGLFEIKGQTFEIPHLYRHGLNIKRGKAFSAG